MKRLIVLALAALALSWLAAAVPPALAYWSPIPRPTLDPAWVCQQLGNCPTPAQHKHARHQGPNVIVLVFEPAVSTAPVLLGPAAAWGP